ncbi:hypothetical protein [Streptomyces sp. NBC_01320]|uniref:hypothetical protein n=1 Tax=Streptomyces sp. NBC_01320 TaxID=2903824 RepID=UPI002E0E051E|nr:nodulation S family protein [Streptomyces sp. NBC_01320]
MSTPAGYFDDLYRGKDDPGHLKERWYEQRKYALTLASLPRPKLGSAFEPACSVDEFSRLLAPRCERLLAVDRVGRLRLGHRPAPC